MTDTTDTTDEILLVEIVLPDGSVATWTRADADDDFIDRLTDAVESVLGSPDTIRC
jgi:hypothetical protein